MTHSLNFSIFQLIINGESPDIIHVKTIEKKLFSFEDKKNNTYYEINKQRTNEYLWLYFKYGKTLPYGDLYDKEKRKTIENPRKKTQLELTNQFFVFIDLRTGFLYISDSRKKGFIENIFLELLEKDTIIKRILISLEEFLTIIKKVKRINFTTTDNIFTRGSGLFDEAGNIFGLGDPEVMELTLDFQKVHLTEKFKDFVKKFNNKKNELEIENLVCVGYDDNELEHIFNTDHLSEKLIIVAEKNSDGLWQPNDVRDNLLQKLN